MKLESETIEEFFDGCQDRQPQMRQLSDFISTKLKAKPTLFSGMGSIKALGWNFIDYKTKSMPKSAPSIKWPIVALAPQKNYISIYICAINEDGRYLAEGFADRLGKVNCGRSCIRFKKLDDLNLNTLGDILEASKSATFGV